MGIFALAAMVLRPLAGDLADRHRPAAARPPGDRHLHAGAGGLRDRRGDPGAARRAAVSRRRHGIRSHRRHRDRDGSDAPDAAGRGDGGLWPRVGRRARRRAVRGRRAGASDRLRARRSSWRPPSRPPPSCWRGRCPRRARRPDPCQSGPSGARADGRHAGHARAVLAALVQHGGGLSLGARPDALRLVRRPRRAPAALRGAAPAGKPGALLHGLRAGEPRGPIAGRPALGPARPAGGDRPGAGHFRREPRPARPRRVTASVPRPRQRSTAWASARHSPPFSR